ncbi:MAG TPA: short-chain dehydrogenase [Erysipelotrichaceae bacterium]|nr:short-chain dehydrogenase [Erysipelotrichaceae bacterium]
MKKPLPDELMFLEHHNAIQKTTDAKLKDKVIVITGATSGVGYEALKRIAHNPVRIFIVARNLHKAQAVKSELHHLPATIEFIIADFSSLHEVRRAAVEIRSQTRKIDILINCAGLHSTKRILTQDGHELVFAVNHLASFLFTHLLLESLKASSPSKILNINSEGHRFNGLDITDLDWQKRHYTGLRGYGASKTAQLLCTWELHDQLAGTGVTINAMHPGDVKTNIGQNNGPLYRLFSKLVIQRILKNPEISGNAIYYLIADPSMEGVSGQYFNLTHPTKPAKHALNRDLGKTVYQLSKDLCEL